MQKGTPEHVAVQLRNSDRARTTLGNAVMPFLRGKLEERPLQGKRQLQKKTTAAKDVRLFQRTDSAKEKRLLKQVE